MPRSVTLPDGSIFPNVPDNISDVDAVKEAVRRGYIEPPEGMLGTFGKNLVSSGLSGIAGLLATGEEALGRQPSDTTRNLRKAAESWQAGPDLGEVAQRALHGDTSGIKYALPAIAGQAIPTLASYLIPGMGAAKLSQLAKAGPALSKLMQAGTALGVGTQAAEGQAILDRAEKGLPTDPAHTLPASIAQGGLDMLALNKILGLKGGVAPTSLLRRVGETAIGEAAVEPIQSMLGRYAELPAGTSPEDIAKYLTTPEAKKGYLGDILAGGLGGGMMGGVSHFGGQRSAEMAHVENLADRALARPRWEDTTSDEREAFAIYNSLNPKAEAEVATEWARQRNDYKANQFTENADNVDFSGTATDLAEDKRDSINSVAEEMDAAEQETQEAPQEIIDPMGMSDEELLSAFDNVDTRTQLTPYQRRRALDLHVRRQEAGRQQERRGFESYLLDTLRAVSQRMGAPTAEELTGVQSAGEMPLLSQEEADAQLKSSGISQLLNLLHQRRQQFAPSANTVIGAPSEESVTPLSAEEATNQQQMGSSLVQLRDVLRQVAQSKGPSAEQVLGTAPAKVDVMDAIQAQAAAMNQRPALPPGTGSINLLSDGLGSQEGRQPSTSIGPADIEAIMRLYSAPENRRLDIEATNEAQAALSALEANQQEFEPSALQQLINQTTGVASTNPLIPMDKAQTTAVAAEQAKAIQQAEKQRFNSIPDNVPVVLDDISTAGVSTSASVAKIVRSREKANLQATMGDIRQALEVLRTSTNPATRSAASNLIAKLENRHQTNAPPPSFPRAATSVSPSKQAVASGVVQNQLFEESLPTAVKGIAGNATTILHNADTKGSVPAEFEIVDADSLNPAVTQSLAQDRDRAGRAAYDKQMREIKSNFNPLMVGPLASSFMQDGPPTVDQKGRIIGGNGRTIALKEMYAEGHEGANRYRDMLMDHADSIGIDPSKIAAMGKPILIRRVTEELTPERISALAEDSNIQTGAGFSTVEQARLDAKKFAPFLHLLVLNDNGTVDAEAKGTQEAAAKAVASLAKSQTNKLVTDTGHANKELLDRLRTALLHEAYGPESTLISRLAEDSQEELRNLNKALLAVAPDVVRIEELIAAGKLDKSASLRNIVDDAVQYLEQARATGVSVYSKVANRDIFENSEAELDRNDPAVRLAVHVESSLGSPRAIREAIKDFAAALEHEARSKGDLIEQASSNIKYARSQKQTETPNFKKWFGDSKVVDAGGKPLVVYHGGSFDETKDGVPKTEGRPRKGWQLSFGMHFAGDKAEAEAYVPKKKGRLTEAYLSLNNPLVLVPDYDAAEQRNIYHPMSKTLYDSIPPKLKKAYDKLLSMAKVEEGDYGYVEWLDKPLDSLKPAEAKEAVESMGFDGVVYEARANYGNGRYRPFKAYIAFHPEQIKSATGNIGTFDPKNPDVRYAAGKSSGTKQTAKTLEAAARKAFGKHTARLMDMGRINIVNSIKDLPGSGHPEDTQALTMPDGSTYYVADQIDPSEIKGLILHEVGAHVGLKSMMGEEAFDNLLKQVSGLQGDAAKAARQAAASYPISEQAEEMLAYLVQNAPQTGIVRRVIATVKNWLNKTFPGLVSLNEADIRSLAEAAVRHVAEFSPMVQSRNQPALAKKVVETAMDRIEEKRIDVPAAVRRVMSKMTSLDQVLDSSPLKKEVSNQLLDPMRRISGMQGLLKKEANALENRVKQAISRRPEVNAMLGDLTNLATIVNHDPSTGPMSEQAKKELVAGLDEEAANKMLADVATLEKMWTDIGARPDGRELHAIFKETREWYQKSLDKFDKAMRARFAKDPNMLDVYKKFYESAKRKVYFPLSRFGDFSVSFENADGDLEYYRFDTQSEMESFVRQVAPRAKQGTLDYGKSIDDIRHLSDDEQARKALADTLAKLAKSPRMKAQAELQALTSRLNENDDISQTSLDDLIKAAKKDGVDSPTLRKLIRSVDRFSRQRDAAEVQKLLDALPTAEKEIRNYLQGIMMAQMPSRSLLKHMMHRKGTLGYTNDFARALSAYNFKLANQLPRLQYRTAINEGKRTVEKALKAAAGIGVDEQGHALKPVITPNIARDITIRINEEVDGVLSPPTISPVVSTITTWAYRKYMATPAAAVFQTSTLPLLSLPMLGSRYGLAKTQGALYFASSLFWDGFSVLGKEVTMDMPKAIKRAHLPPRKRAELLDAWQKMEESGVVAHGEIQQALGGGKSPTSSVLNPNPVQKKASEALRWIDGLFSAGDAAPRHVTALAAYQLARDAGKSHEDAIRDAIDQTYEALGDYSDVGRPAITRGNIGRILYQFQSYSQKMMSTLFRLYSEWRGANLSHLSPKEQKEVSRRALRSMTGILASHALLAGSLGLPFAATLMGLTDLLRDEGDEDEYHDAEIDMRRFMKNELGMTEFMTRAFMEGLPGALLDMKVSTRIGAGELPLRLEFEKKTAEENMKENFFKTFGGTAGSFATDIGKAVDYLNRGDYGRAFETLTPVALSRAAASAYRMASEGVKTRQGGVLVSPEEMSMVGLIGQALGVSNLSAYEMRQEKFYLKRAEVFINDRKKELYNAYNTALETGDQQKVNEVLEEIARFNKHYTDPKTGKGLITPESLKKSVDNHKKFLDTNGALGLGININPKMLPFIAGPRELEELVSANR